jgi:hypothetical protein
MVVQQLPEGDLKAASESHMVFSEFVDALLSVVCYKIPDPFLPLEKRADKFFAESISPFVGK